MDVVLNRVLHGVDSTLGVLSIDGQHQCFIVEDEPRAVKLYGETRIPAGVYPIRLHTAGRFHARYSERFADIHEGMLELVGVEGFRWILIHAGNTDDDTAGCLLPNMGARITEDGEVVGSSSVQAYKLIYPRIAEAILRGERVSITVQDEKE